MTTATKPASLEAAIAKAIKAQWSAEFTDEADSLEGGLGYVITTAAEPFVDSAARTLESAGGSAWEPIHETGPLAIWQDLRPSEAVRLMELVSSAKDRAVEQCLAIIEMELTAVGLAFAAEYPDAQRAGATE